MDSVEGTSALITRLSAHSAGQQKDTAHCALCSKPIRMRLWRVKGGLARKIMFQVPDLCNFWLSFHLAQVCLSYCVM